MPKTTTEPGPIVLDGIVAQIFTAQITASQNAANAVLENVERERDQAEQTFIEFYDAVAKASADSPVTVKAIDAALLRFGHRADLMEQSRQFRAEGPVWAREEADRG